MAKKRKVTSGGNEDTELLRDLLIVQLGLAGVPQSSIRAIARCDINRVNRVVKHLKQKKDKEKTKGR